MAGRMMFSKAKLMIIHNIIIIKKIYITYVYTNFSNIFGKNDNTEMGL